MLIRLGNMSYSLDDPPNSRLFIVAGRNTSVRASLRISLLHQIACQPPTPNLSELFHIIYCRLSSLGTCSNNMAAFHSSSICVTKVRLCFTVLSLKGHSGPELARQGASGGCQGPITGIDAAVWKHPALEIITCTVLVLP